MQITKHEFLNILQQENLIELAGKGVTDENLELVISLSMLLQEYDLCNSGSYAEAVAFEFFEEGLDAAFSLVQFAKEDSTIDNVNKLKVILEEHPLDLKDWNRLGTLFSNIKSIIDQLRNKSESELDNFIDLFLHGKSIALQGGSIQGTKSYNANAPKKSKIGDG